MSITSVKIIPARKLEAGDVRDAVSGYKSYESEVELDERRKIISPSAYIYIRICTHTYIHGSKGRRKKKSTHTVGISLGAYSYTTWPHNRENVSALCHSFHHPPSPSRSSPLPRDPRNNVFARGTRVTYTDFSTYVRRLQTTTRHPLMDVPDNWNVFIDPLFSPDLFFFSFPPSPSFLFFFFRGVLRHTERKSRESACVYVCASSWKVTGNETWGNNESSLQGAVSRYTLIPQRDRAISFESSLTFFNVSIEQRSFIEFHRRNGV